MKTNLLQCCGHCWVFQICWHIECSTFIASSFRIWNSSAGIPSPPLALFIVMLPKAHLPFLSYYIKSEWVQVSHLYLTLCNPMDCSPPGSSVHGPLPVRISEWVSISFSKNTGVSSHSFLQGIFQSQGLNPGVLHCRQILYHLSYQVTISKVHAINVTYHVWFNIIRHHDTSIHWCIVHICSFLI